MKNAVGFLVVAMAVAFAACGGKGSSADGGRGGAAGGGAGRGGVTGGAGTTGTAGTTGAAGVTGGAGTTGTAGTTGAAGTGGTTGRGGTTGVGGGGTTGSAGIGGTSATGTAGTGSAGRGGSTGSAGSGGRGGTGGSDATGTAGTGGTQPPRCTAPADCGTPPAGVGFCGGTLWSCVEGVCVAECMGGRTCTLAPDSGCLRCRTPPSITTMSLGCVGTPCVFTAGQVRDVQRSSSCQASNTPDFSTWHCTGQWATLAVVSANNTVCTIQDVFTDAIRYSVSCGSCVTVVTIGN